MTAHLRVHVKEMHILKKNTKKTLEISPAELMDIFRKTGGNSDKGLFYQLFWFDLLVSLYIAEYSHTFEHLDGGIEYIKSLKLIFGQSQEVCRGF